MKRRDLLKGFSLGAGAALLTPTLRALIAEAAGAPRAAAHRRLVMFIDAHGTITEPGEPHRFVAGGPELSAATLPPSLEPLAPYQDDLLVLDSFYHPFPTNELHSTGATMLTMQAEGGISFDQVLAAAQGSDDPYGSINLSLPFGVSAPSRDANGRVGSLSDPAAAYQALFGQYVASGQDIAENIGRRQSLMDFMRDDISHVNQRLAGPERLKLEQYLDSIERVEQQLKGTLDALENCAVPSAPDSGLAELAEQRNELNQDIVKANLALGVAALRCRLTHILGLGMMTGRNTFWFLAPPGTPAPEDTNLGLATGDKHNLHHTKRADWLVNVDRWFAGNVRELWEGLLAVPEGDGTMADNTLVVWMNLGGGTHHRGNNGHVFVTLGRLGGALQTGRYVSFPEMEHSVADVYVSLGNALGLDMDTFGDPVHCKGPLPGLS